MPRRSDPLGRVGVNKPCTADWDSMVGSDQVRFCTHCKLDVHDLSSMTRADARRLVRRHGDALCVRYYSLPDGTPRTLDAAPRLHRIARRASTLAAGAFGAVLTLSTGAAAQTGAQASAEARGVAEQVVREGAALGGTISDPNGAVILNAPVTARNVETGQAFAVFTDLDGAYRFARLPPGTYELTAAAEGFRPGEIMGLELRKGSELTRDVALEVRGPEETVEVNAQLDTTTVVMGGAMIVRPKEPLVLAASEGNRKGVAELLASGSDVNALDADTDTTALMEAVGRGDAETSLALVGAGADVNLRAKTGQTALMSLDDEATADIALALLSAGARVDLFDEEGSTALMFAAGRVKVEVLRALLEAGAKVGAKNRYGRTPLMWAAQSGMVENARALLIAGADVNGRSEDGETALSIARDAEYAEVVALLVAYGAFDEEK